MSLYHQQQQQSLYHHHPATASLIVDILLTLIVLTALVLPGSSSKTGLGRTVALTEAMNSSSASDMTAALTHDLDRCPPLGTQLLYNFVSSRTLVLLVIFVCIQTDFYVLCLLVLSLN